MDHICSNLTVNLAQYSDKGVKKENQDTIGAQIPQGNALVTKGIAVVVADGVSSSASAQQASQSAVTGFLTDYYATPDTWRTAQSATRVIHSLNRYLWGQSQNSVSGEGYLTTFSALIMKGDKAFIFHVGDSRVYRIREGVVEQLTRDHAQAIDKHTTYLSRALGADPSLEIDIHTEELQKGDFFVLTTDGIHDFIAQNEFSQILRSSDDPEVVRKAAVEKALENDSDDNLSIQVVQVLETGNPSQKDAMTVLSQLPFPPLLEVGQKIDGLAVEKVIHESERSQVYIVKDPSGRKLIMKTPSPNYEDDPAYIERFVMESWIGTRVQNAQVVKVVPPIKERKFLYYLTEHINGPSLGELIKERAPFDIQGAVELMEQLVKGVRAFHRRDMLHQDIKPDNVIIGPQGPVVIDFGSCWVAGIQEAGTPFTRDLILGTLTYSAPEYRYGGQVSQRSEQFSLGVILYEMLTNQQPYGERFSEINNLKAFQKLKYIPARKHNPLVPRWLDKAIEKSVSIHPKSRYEALSEWLTDIKRPNPMWVAAEARPLMERDPVKFWKIAALLGWVSAVALLLKDF